MQRLLLLIAPIAVVHGLPFQQIPLGDPTIQHNPLDGSFDKLAEDALKSFNVPGFSIAVVKGNETHAKGYGIAQLPDTKATAESLYFAGSTTKSFTAASVLKLIEDDSKSITLRSKISEFIPWKFQDEYVTDHATLEDALSHRTGMPRHDMSYGGPNYTADDMIDAMQHLPLTRELRQEWQYCNMMFLVVSRIIEKLSGTTLATFFKTNIWERLGMKHTSMDLEAANATSNLSTGYFWDNSTKEFFPYEYADPVFVSGAGGIITSVSDYAIYLRAMLQQDPAILGPSSYRELRRARMIAPPFLREDIFTGPMSYGLGWFFSVYNGYEVIHHSGGVPGFATNMFYVPERDFGGVIMANADLGGAPLTLLAMFELLDREIGMKRRPDVVGIWDNIIEARRHILETLREVAFPDAPPPEEAIPHTLPLDAYTGSYWHPAYRHINLTLASPPSFVGVPVPSENGTILHADVGDRAWPHVLDFEHVNAEHFLVRWHFALDQAKDFDSSVEAMRAEFEIGTDGKVSRMGLGYEPSMGFENLVWFEKVKS